MRTARARGGADAVRRRALASTLRALVERTHDFTDSAYTSHDHRQRILALAERIAYELERLVAVAVSLVSESKVFTAAVTAISAYNILRILYTEMAIIAAVKNFATTILSGNFATTFPFFS